MRYTQLSGLVCNYFLIKINFQVQIKSTLIQLLINFMQQNHKQDQVVLKSVFYVKKNQNEPPFMASIQLKPYVNTLNDKSQYVKIVAPYSKNQADIPNLIHPQNIPPLARLNNPNELKNELPFSQNNPNTFIRGDNYQDINHFHGIQSNKKSNCAFNTASFILIFFTLGFCITIQTFFGITLRNVINDQYYYYYVYYYSWARQSPFFITFIACYSVVMFIRFIIHLITCFRNQLTSGQRVSFGISLFCPLLKYHLIKRRPNDFGLSLKPILITDIIATFFLLAAGVFSLVSYDHALSCYYNYYYYYYGCYHFDQFLLSGIFLLVEVFFQLLGYLLYRNFLSEKLKQQKFENIQKKLFNDINYQNYNQRLIVPQIQKNYDQGYQQGQQGYPKVYPQVYPQQNGQLYAQKQPIYTRNAGYLAPNKINESQKSYQTQYPSF